MRSVATSRGTLEEWRALQVVLQAGEDRSWDVARVPHPLPVLQCQPSGGRLADDIAEDARRTSATQRQKLWQSMHRGTLRADCAPIGQCPPVRRLCFEAQRCVCKGDGLLLARLHRRLQAAFHQSRKDFGDLAFKTSLLGGYLVLRTRSRPIDAPAACCQQQGGGLGGHPDSDAHIGIESVWVHISAMCLRPWRPTCLIMDRCAAFDRNGLVGLRVARDSNDKPVLSWRTMWEVVAALQLSTEHVLSWYRLTALPQTTFELDPSRQRDSALGLPEQLVWRGSALEQLKRGGQRWRRTPTPRPALLDADRNMPSAAPADIDGNASVSDGEAQPEEAPAEADEPPLDDCCSSSSSSEGLGEHMVDEGLAPSLDPGSAGPERGSPGDVGRPRRRESVDEGEPGAEPIAAEHFEQALDITGIDPQGSAGGGRDCPSARATSCGRCRNAGRWQPAGTCRSRHFSRVARVARDASALCGHQHSGHALRSACRGQLPLDSQPRRERACAESWSRAAFGPSLGLVDSRPAGAVSWRACA